jgi:hypothetical protein
MLLLLEIRIVTRGIVDGEKGTLKRTRGMGAD